MERNKVHTLVLYALFVGMIFVLALTPIGYITAGPIEITLIHIPVILGSFFLGLRGGLVLGFFFGLSSLLNVVQAVPLLPAVERTAAAHHVVVDPVGIHTRR